MWSNKKISAVIVAAGKGLRMGGDIPKQYLLLAGEPILAHTVRAFAKSCVDDIVVVCPAGDEEYVKTMLYDAADNKLKYVVCGGKERFDSCRIGIEAALNCEVRPDYVLIQDGVRSLVTPDIISRVAEALGTHDACCPGVKLKDTVRIVDAFENGIEVPDRNCYRIIQTPQGFKADEIEEAYRRFEADSEMNDALRKTITDDAMIYEKYISKTVYITEGSYDNIKITTPEDILLAEAILKQRHSK